jgi:hypothetical protein
MKQMFQIVAQDDDEGDMQPRSDAVGSECRGDTLCHYHIAMYIGLTIQTEGLRCHQVHIERKTKIVKDPWYVCIAMKDDANALIVKDGIGDSQMAVSFELPGKPERRPWAQDQRGYGVPGAD